MMDIGAQCPAASYVQNKHPLLVGQGVVEPIVGKRQCDTVLSITQVENRVGLVSGLPPRDPRPAGPAVHQSYAVQHRAAVSFLPGLCPAHQQRHHACLHLPCAMQMLVVHVARVGEQRHLCIVRRITRDLRICRLQQLVLRPPSDTRQYIGAHVEPRVRVRYQLRGHSGSLSGTAAGVDSAPW